MSKLLNSKYTLFPHQEVAMRFMRHREATPHHGIRGGFLVMEMGLGKTLTAIMHSLTSPKHPLNITHGTNGFPTLVVCSKTVMVSWKIDAFEKFFGDRVKVLYLHPSYMGQRIKTINREKLVEYDFVITTYGIITRASKNHAEIIENVLMRGLGTNTKKINKLGVRTQSPWNTNKPDWKGTSVLFGTPFERIIADESQFFCNHKTQLYRAMMALWGKYKWCLTGTPIKNSPVDIWSQLRFCGYESVKQYHGWTPWKMQEHSLTDVILEMSFQSLNITMPQVKTHNVIIEMSDPEKKLYNQLVVKTIELYENVIGGVDTMSSIFAQMTRLRLSSIAPSLIVRNRPYEHDGTYVKSLSEYVYECINESQKRALPPYFKMSVERRINVGRPWVHKHYEEAGVGSSKIQHVLRIVTGIKEAKEKVIIFSSFRCALDITTEAMRMYAEDIKYLQIDGTVSHRKREKILKEFAESDDETSATVLFMTYKVGAEGINVTCANNMIFLEPWWTPSVFQQGIARIWRTGQTKDISVYYLIMKGTIEEKIIGVCQKKTTMTNTMLSKGMSMNLIKHLLIEQ